ncbi:MAG: HEAT repeat domain-containing protein, partial [Planctomycetota bacterium]|nr:HEAT repeat domain-containing protein [Planctomycetota bacterium]
AAAIPILMNALNDPDEMVQEFAVRGFGKIGPKSIPRLLTALKDGDELARYRAATSFRFFLPKHATSAIPSLIEATKDPNKSVANEALIALSRLAPDSDSFALRCIEILQGPRKNLYDNTLIALRYIRPKSTAALPVIEPYLKHPNQGTRVLARLATKSIREKLPSPKSPR